MNITHSLVVYLPTTGRRPTDTLERNWDHGNCGLGCNIAWVGIFGCMSNPGLGMVGEGRVF